jgi:uncharacterized membrane protein YhaH (DUF805 family)
VAERLGHPLFNINHGEKLVSDRTNSTSGFRSGDVGASAPEETSFASTIIGFWFFRGRIGRKTFWIESILLFIFSLIFYVWAVLSGFVKNDIPTSNLIWIPVLAMSWINLAATVKRWHDLNHSGWMTLLNFAVIPIPFTFIYTYFFRGTIGPNRFGTDPI